MDNLYFKERGSGGNLYKVTFSGAGENLAAFCACPAGSRSRVFCKHVAMMLMGEESKIAEGGDQLQELQERAQGSPLIQKARSHKPSPSRPEQIHIGPIYSLEDLEEYVAEKIAGASIWHEHFKSEDGSASLCVFRGSKKEVKTLDSGENCLRTLHKRGGKIHPAL